MADVVRISVSKTEAGGASLKTAAVRSGGHRITAVQESYGAEGLHPTEAPAATGTGVRSRGTQIKTPTSTRLQPLRRGSHKGGFSMNNHMRDRKGL